ncbi:hypothetical protein AN161_11405 [Lysinibacillus sp. FJAT-14222]|nr:hypothetical protein AN161_11405 [Lysinibacillus sp. FJAT-14222]
MGICNRGTKAKSITSCDNAFVTNILLARDPAAKRSGSSDAPRKLCSVRKRSDSNKAPSRNGNQPHVMRMKEHSQQLQQNEKETLSFLKMPLFFDIY